MGKYQYQYQYEGYLPADEGIKYGLDVIDSDYEIGSQLVEKIMQSIATENPLVFERIVLTKIELLDIKHDI